MKFAGFALSLVLLSGGLVSQTIWHVQGNGTPGGSGSQASPFGSVQQAITASATGDLIVVGSGTYSESLDTQHKALTIVGSGATGSGATIIDASQQAPVSLSGGLAFGVVAIAVPDHDPSSQQCMSENTNVSINAISIRGGDFGIHFGQAVCFNNYVTLQACEITQNVIGIFGRGAILNIASCDIHGNTSVGVDTCDSWVEIDDSYIRYNDVGVSTCIGGVTIRRSQVHHNTGDGCGGCSHYVDIQDSILFSNGGYGVDLSAALASAVSNSTIWGNLAGGILEETPSTPTHLTSVTNSILWSNGTPGSLQISPSPSGLTVIQSCVEGGWLGAGNTNLDPLLFAPNNGDFHLTLQSPCIDAGGLCVGVDFEGDSRPHGMACDMGADEYFTLALSETMGVGCAGPAQPAPLLATNRAPLLGSSYFVMELTDAAPGSTASLMWSAAELQTSIGSCVLHLAPDIHLFDPLPISPAGTIRFSTPLPGNPALAGIDIYLQYAIVDPLGPISALGSTFSLSNGLHLKFGL